MGIVFVLLLCCFTTIVVAQRTSVPAFEQNKPGISGPDPYIDSVFSVVKKKIADRTADSFHLGIFKPFSICKQQFKTDAIKMVGDNKKPNDIHRPKLLTIHGNISYDFFYRSRIDTPISQQDFQQHTERVYLNILYKEKYPLKVSFVLRQSNSPYFSNFNDLNFQFDRSAFSRDFKKEILQKLSAQIPKRPDLLKLETDLKKSKEELQQLKGWISSSSTLQKIIEEREREYYRKLSAQIPAAPNQAVSDSLKNAYTDSLTQFKDSLFDFVNNNVDSLKTRLSDGIQAKKDSLSSKIKQKITGVSDSLTGKFAEVYEKKKAQIDSLENKVKQQQRKLDSLSTVLKQDIQKVRQKISRASGEKELKRIAASYGLGLDSLNKFQSKLAAIRNFSIGRSIIDYTELTAQNITVTGINVEYNPSYYAAFAAGKINYRFRDFFNRNSRSNSQYLVLGRFGWGNKDKAALIFTVFQGRKSQSNFALSDSVSGHVNLLGYSAEATWKKDENTGLSIEVAKSTIPSGGVIQNSQQTKALWNFSETSNMGVNIKGQTVIPETDTKLSGFYRRTGENFQSFSLFSYNTNQTAWQLRADQPFFKNRVTFTGMLRRNDFTNPFTDRTYTSSTVFKSVLVNIRFPKYPAISIGYYPGTQLYVINTETIRENAYYMLNASMVYGYKYRGISMNSSVVYNRYYNQSTDSGFILYKGVNYYISQNIFLKKLQLQGAYSYTKQPELEYYTLESSGDYSLGSTVKIGAGIKYNQVHNGNQYWGKRLMLSADFKKMGGITIQYEKSYLPTLNQSLYPVEIGRVSWFKIF